MSRPSATVSVWRFDNIIDCVDAEIDCDSLRAYGLCGLGLMNSLGFGGVPRSLSSVPLLDGNAEAPVLSVLMRDSSNRANKPSPVLLASNQCATKYPLADRPARRAP